MASGILTEIAHTLLDALLPEECVVCEAPLVEGERYMCLHCLADMPRVRTDSLTKNSVHDTLASTHPVDRAVSLFRYRRGSPYTRLIHHAKYNSRPHLSRWLGRQLGTAFSTTGFFEGVDALVPVPLNGWKMIRRGYNQSELLAKGISDVTGIAPVNVMKARRHQSQTSKNAINRRLNAQGVYTVKSAKKLEGLKHVVIVDDVITTGSTMLECANAIREANPEIRVSVASAALTEL